LFLEFVSVVSQRLSMAVWDGDFKDMMFNTKLIVALSASTLVGSFAAADMTGSVYQNQYSVSAVDGFGAPDFNGTVVDLWMEFDDAADILLNVYNFNDVNLGATYYQSFTGATWLPNNLGAPFETDALRDADSFVSIGGDGGAQTNANGTGLDPNFGGTGAAGPGADGGWYNSDPGTPIGAVVSTSHTASGLGVFIGRFSMNGGSVDLGGSTGAATWNQGIGTEGYQAGFTVKPIPTPGALALLGLAGLAGRRRRN
jgi:hypothetical protein